MSQKKHTKKELQLLKKKAKKLKKERDAKREKLNESLEKFKGLPFGEPEQNDGCAF